MRELNSIEATDDEIEAALRAASPVALLLSTLHMTGDETILESSIRPGVPEMMQTDGGLTEDECAQVRAQAMDAIRVYRRTDRPAIALPSSTLARMAAFAVGETALPDDLRGLCLEELALDDPDPRRRDIAPDAVARCADDFHVVIIGAGLSGLLLAYRLDQQGIPFTILEKSQGVGGTWYENRYPGCRVDIASHAYSYSFDEARWKAYFATYDELKDYFEDFAERCGLSNRIVFGAEAERATFDEASGCWSVIYRSGSERREIVGNALVSAVGQLNRPKTPDVPGRDRFEGPQMHTAQWDPSIDLEGKRVAVVGSGASALQLVPELAKTASQLTVFQRTPSWMFPNPGYHERVSDNQQWCLDHLPGYARWFRFLTLWPMLDKAHSRVVVDPAWEDDGLSCSAANREMRDQLVAYISSQIDDPALREASIPDYPPFGTRTLQDNGSWLRALQRDNVELVASGVTEITPTGLVSESGTFVEVDAILWATGFHADRFLWPMEVVGRSGLRLADAWRDTPRAYLGLTVPHFPNLYSLYGPNTNVAHTGNVIMVTECQVGYVMSALERMLKSDLKTIECREEAAAEYESRLSEALSRRVWSYPNVHSFYRNETGRVVVNMPWKMADYWAWTRELRPEDFHLVPKDGSNGSAV